MTMHVIVRRCPSYRQEVSLVCGYEDGHEDIFTNEDVFESTGNVFSGDDVFGEHTHTDDCFVTTRILVCDDRMHTHSESYYINDISSDNIIDITPQEDLGDDMWSSENIWDENESTDKDSNSSTEDDENSGNEIDSAEENNDTESSDIVQGEHDDSFEGEAEDDGNSAESEDGTEIEDEESGNIWGNPNIDPNKLFDEDGNISEDWLAKRRNWMRYYDTDGDGQITFTVEYLLHKPIPITLDGTTSPTDIEMLYYDGGTLTPYEDYFGGERKSGAHKLDGNVFSRYIPATLDTSFNDLDFWSTTKLSGLSTEDAFNNNARGMFGCFYNTSTRNTKYAGYMGARYVIARRTFTLTADMTIKDLLLDYSNYFLADYSVENGWKESSGREQFVMDYSLDPAMEINPFDTISLIDGNYGVKEQIVDSDNLIVGDAASTSWNKNGSAVFSTPWAENIRRGAMIGQYYSVTFKQNPLTMHKEEFVPPTEKLFTNTDSNLLDDYSLSKFIFGQRESVSSGMYSEYTKYATQTQYTNILSTELMHTMTFSSGGKLDIPCIPDGTVIYLEYTVDSKDASKDIAAQDVTYYDYEFDDRVLSLGRDDYLLMGTYDSYMTKYPLHVPGDLVGIGHFGDRNSPNISLYRYTDGALFRNSFGVVTNLLPYYNDKTNTFYHGGSSSSSYVSPMEWTSTEVYSAPLEFMKTGDHYILIGAGSKEEYSEDSALSSLGTYDMWNGGLHSVRTSSGIESNVGGLYSLFPLKSTSHFSSESGRIPDGYPQRGNGFYPYKSFWTNWFWPLPTNYTHGWNPNYGPGSTESVAKIAWDPYYGTTADNVVVHNDYFVMQYETEISIPYGYVGPLDFTFFGDDDLFVYLDGRCVVDLGGIHRSVGAYVNLWDALPELKAYNEELFNEGRFTPYEITGDAPEQKHTLTFLYMERGSYGSTCYIDMTLPIIESSEKPVDTTNVILTKDLIAPEIRQGEEFSFEVKFSDNSSFNPELFNNIGVNIYDEDGKIRDSAVISQGINNTIHLKDGQYAEFRDVPTGTWISIEEVFAIEEIQEGYHISMELVKGDMEQSTDLEWGLSSDANPIVRGNKFVARINEGSPEVRIVCYNVDSLVEELPRTGGPGTTLVITAGLCTITLSIAALLGYKRTRKGF